MSFELREGTDEKGKYRQYVDTETGEVSEKEYLRSFYVKDGHYLLQIDPSLKDEKGRQPWFFRIYRTNWMDLILRKRLSIHELGVLVALMTFLDWESNYLVHPKTKELLSLNKLAELLQTNRDQLDKTIKSLNDKGLVAITSKGKGRGKAFQLNSHVLFYGEKFRDLNEHKVFDDCAYEPVVDKRYKQRETK